MRDGCEGDASGSRRCVRQVRCLRRFRRLREACGLGQVRKVRQTGAWRRGLHRRPGRSRDIRSVACAVGRCGKVQTGIMVGRIVEVEDRFHVGSGPAAYRGKKAARKIHHFIHVAPAFERRRSADGEHHQEQDLVHTQVGIAQLQRPHQFGQVRAKPHVLRKPQGQCLQPLRRANWQRVQPGDRSQILNLAGKTIDHLLRLGNMEHTDPLAAWHLCVTSV